MFLKRGRPETDDLPIVSCSVVHTLNKTHVAHTLRVEGYTYTILQSHCFHNGWDKLDLQLCITMVQSLYIICVLAIHCIQHHHHHQHHPYSRALIIVYSIYRNYLHCSMVDEGGRCVPWRGRPLGPWRVRPGGPGKVTSGPD